MERDSSEGRAPLSGRVSERDSWPEEIDALRSDNGRDSWSGVGVELWRDSLHTLEDDVMTPNKRDSPYIKLDSDPRAHERLSFFEERHQRDAPPVERPPPARGAYERPARAYERLSVDKAHTMKDFEKQITELKKENFNLKLRIYFLEERVQRRCDDSSSDELHRMNIELKVEVESLKHDFQEKQNLLVRASKAMESLAGEHGLALQKLKEDNLRQLRALEDDYRPKLRALEEERRREKAELDRVRALLEQERAQRYGAEERLLAVKEQYSKSAGVLEERDWIIECLNETLRSKDSLITQLEKQIHAMMPPPGEAGPLSEERLGSPGLSCRECLATRPPEDSETIDEWQKKVQEMGKVIGELQHKLEANKAGLASEEKNALKRDKAIQGLTVALKTKTKENQKLQKDVENLNAALARAGESSHNLQEPEYKKLLVTIQTQQELCTRLRQYQDGSGSLHKELDAILMLRQWLEKDIRANEELRKVLEAQIAAKYRDSDTFSFLGDQTSYMSICLNKDRVDAENRPLMISVGVQAAEEHVQGSGWRQGIPLDQCVAEESISPACSKSEDHQPEAASSSTQTELKYFSDKGVLVDFESQIPRREGFAIESEIPPFSAGNLLRHSNKRQKCLSNNLTKSRIPVLVKSYPSAQLKAEAWRASLEAWRASLEKELQEENGRLYHQLRSAELEIEALRSSRERPSPEALRSSLERPSPEALRSSQERPSPEALRPSQERPSPEALRPSQERPSPEALRPSRERPSPEALRSSRERPSPEALRSSQERPSPEALRSSRERPSPEALRSSRERPSPEALRSSRERPSPEALRSSQERPSPEALRSSQERPSPEALRSSRERPSPEALRSSQERPSPEALRSSRERPEEDYSDGVDTDSLDGGMSHGLKTAGEKMLQPDTTEEPDATTLQALYKELLAEKDRLSEQLQCARMEIERLRSIADFANHEEEDAADHHRSGSSLQEQLQMENVRLAEQLKREHVTIEMLQARSPSDMGDGASNQTPPWLQMENVRLAEELKHAHVTIETLQARRSPSDMGDGDSRNQPSLQIDHVKLSEQCKPAQMDIKELVAKLSSLEVTRASSHLDSAEHDRPGQSELQIEHVKLAEQLKRAHVTIEKLQAIRSASDVGDGASTLTEPWPENVKLSHQGTSHQLDIKELAAKLSMLEVTRALSDPDTAEQDPAGQLQMEYVRPAQMDIKELVAKLSILEDTRASSYLDTEEQDPAGQMENDGLGEQLKPAQMDIKEPAANLSIMRTSPNHTAGRHLSGQSLEDKLPIENLNLSEPLQMGFDRRSTLGDVTVSELYVAERDTGTKTGQEDLIKQQVGPEKLQEMSPSFSLTNAEARALPELPLVRELTSENLRLTELLRQAWADIESLQARGNSLADGAAEIVGAATSQNESFQMSENLQLGELLKRTQTGVESLKKTACTMGVQNAVPNLGGANTSTGPILQEDLSSERLNSAQMDAELSKARKRELGLRSSASDPTEGDLSDRTLLQELRSENQRLAEHLRCALMDAELSKARERELGLRSSALDPSEGDLSDRTLLEELRSENQRLAERLRCALMDAELSKARERELGLRNSASDAAEQELLKELRLENQRLAERLRCSQIDAELSKEHELGLRNSVSNPAKQELQECLRCAQMDAELSKPREHELGLRNSASDPAKQELLQECLRCAQMDAELSKEHELGLRNSASDPTEGELNDRTLLELRSENQRLAERLSCAQMEIAKLREEKTLLEEMGGAFTLENGEEQYSELSLVDKTITNSGVIPGGDLEMDYTSRNVAGLRCHHDRHCSECGNNRETLVLQAERKLLTVSRSHRSFDGDSASKYDLLVQSQARELSHQRQKIKESHNLSVVCAKNFANAVKALEELVLAPGVALGFREQLAQTAELLNDLEYRLSDAYYDEDDANSDLSGDSSPYTPSRLVPGHRMWADKRGGHVLGLVEDYDALRKQILEAKAALQEMEAFAGRGVQTAALNMSDRFAQVFFEKLNRTKQSLEEAGCLLKLLWRVSLPLQGPAPSSYSTRRVEETELELTRLRQRVLEQDKLLSGMVKRVYSENQVKEDIEKLILDQLAMTHQILKRAKGNLEVQVVK